MSSELETLKAEIQQIQKERDTLVKRLKNGFEHDYLPTDKIKFFEFLVTKLPLNPKTEDLHSLMFRAWQEGVEQYQWGIGQWRNEFAKLQQKLEVAKSDEELMSELVELRRRVRTFLLRKGIPSNPLWTNQCISDALSKLESEEK